MKPKPPTEEQECVTLTHYLDLLKNQGKVIMFAHIINELSLNRKRGQKPNFAFLNKRKASGWRPGVPDYLIVTKDKVLFIEMKRIKLGVISDPQKQWIKAINDARGHAVVCKGFDSAKIYLDSMIE